MQKIISTKLLENPQPIVEICRSISIKLKKKKGKTGDEKICPDRTCGKKEKGSFWSFFGKERVMKDFTPEQTESCKREVAQRLNFEDPDLSGLGGKAFRTCGEAYVIQRDHIEAIPSEKLPEDDALKKIESPHELKDVVDPLPNFESVENRLLELNEKKLHPYYKKYIFMQKKAKPIPPKVLYKTRSGPINFDDVPKQLKLNKELMEKKNIYSDFKRVDPPKQLLAKLIEMRENEKPTLEQRKCNKEPECDT